MRALYILLLVVGGCWGQAIQSWQDGSTPFILSRLRRGSEQDFWNIPSINYNAGGIEAGYPIMDIPVNDVSVGQDRGLDKIQVVSSAIRVLPRHKGRSERKTRQIFWRQLLDKVAESHPKGSLSRRKRETIQSWRRPRDFHFVTNNKEQHVPPPPIARFYPPVDRSERFYDRDYRKKSQRRIIYYANLPEIVRPPVQWYNTRGDYYDSPRQAYSTGGYSQSPSPSGYSFSSSPYPSPSENEITRVQSNIIDVTNSRYNERSPSPKFTIIDVEPPYNFPNYYNRPPVRYDTYPSSQPQYTSNTFYNDVRTPPYRDYSHFPTQSFRPNSSLEPVKLQIPTTDYPSTVNSTELPTNTTRFLPDSIPVSLRSLSKFAT